MSQFLEIRATDYTQRRLAEAHGAVRVASVTESDMSKQRIIDALGGDLSTSVGAYTPTVLYELPMLQLLQTGVSRYHEPVGTGLSRLATQDTDGFMSRYQLPYVNPREVSLYLR